jgi:alpha-1,6-mannosyltransferase
LRAGAAVRARRAVGVGVVSAGLVVVAGWLAGVGTGWIGALSVPDAEYTALSLPAVAGRWIRILLDRSGPAGLALAHTIHPELLAKRVGVILVVLVAVLVVLRWRTGTPRSAVEGTGVVLLAAVVLSPVVHYWYFLWCIPVLACLPLRRRAGAALLAGALMLGLTAVGDRALGIRWLWESASWAVLLVPVFAALASRPATRQDTAI